MKKVITSLVASLLLLSSATSSADIESIFERDPGLPIVYLNVVIKGGATTDAKDKLGITRFMGLMLLRGTKLRNKEQIDLEIDQIGSSLEIETDDEAMIIRGSVLSSQLEPFLKLFQEIITEPSFPQREIEKLRAETISKLMNELGDDMTVGGKKFQQHLFDGHPYGNPVRGTITTVKNFTRADIIAQYNLLLRNKNMFVIGNGYADKDRIKQWAGVLSESCQGNSVLPKLPNPTDLGATSLLLVDKPDRTQTQIFIGQIGLRVTDPDYIPLRIANQAFGGDSFLSRLMQEIRVKRGWSYGAYSYFEPGSKPKSWQLHIYPASKDAPAALTQLLQMIKDFREKGLSKEEFEFAKVKLINSDGFRYNTPKKRVGLRVLERTLEIPDGYLQSYLERTKQTTLEKVNSALKRFLKPEKLFITVLGTAQNLKEPLAKAAGLTGDKVSVINYTEE